MISNKWEPMRLGDILNFRRGHDLPKKKMKEGNYPVVGSNGVIGYHNDYTTESPCITIGRSGNVGKPHIVYEKAWAHNTTLYIDNFKGNSPEFIYYFLKTLDLGYYAGGSAVPTLNRNHIHPIEVNVPVNVEEQKKIANILLTLDEKIETNNQINEKLEEMAQALFKHWFVDFEFPNENGEPYKSSGGEMVESELGMIPKGWEALYLNQVVEVKYGRNLPTKDLTDSGYPVFGGNGLIGFYTKYLYKDPQVLIACRGAASGKVLLSLPFSFVTNNSLILENNQKIVSFEYLSQFCLFYEFYNFVTGSAQPQITINNLNKAKILIPNKKLHDEYTNVISALNTKILKLKKETEILKQIRDTLLPKLMSGEIRIPMEDGVLSEKN